MDKKQSAYFGIGVALLVVVVVVLLVRGTHLESADIVLPENPTGAAEPEDSGPEGQLNVVEITPETVRPAIATLSRPLAYSRAQTVETFWSGGSGQSVSQVYVSGAVTRLDTHQSDGCVRHTLVSGDAAAVWYDDEENWTVLHSPDLTADAAGRMLTYETVRDLPVDRIASAGFIEKDGVQCVYVETLPDSGGYTEKYWVSVDWGLLYAAERACNGELIYRFSSAAPENAPVDSALFFLPDGSELTTTE